MTRAQVLEAAEGHQGGWAPLGEPGLPEHEGTPDQPGAVCLGPREQVRMARKPVRWPGSSVRGSRRTSTLRPAISWLRARLLPVTTKVARMGMLTSRSLRPRCSTGPRGPGQDGREAVAIEAAVDIVEEHHGRPWEERRGQALAHLIGIGARGSGRRPAPVRGQARGTGRAGSPRVRGSGFENTNRGYGGVD